MRSRSIEADAVDDIREQTIDYIKILHEICLGRWNQQDEKTSGDSEALIQSADGFIVQLVNCIDESFDYPVVTRVYPDLGLDVNMLSVSMATIFQILKQHPKSSNQLSMGSVEAVFKTCLSRLVDSRLTSDVINFSEESYKVTCNITKGLNMIALKLASEANNGTVICALLRVLLSCALFEVDIATSQPCSRLLLHVLSDEVSKASPFTLPSVDIRKVLLELHDFYNKHPLTQVEEDRPFRGAKTVLNELVKVHGAKTIVNILQELDLPSQSFVFKLTSKLGHLSAPEINPELSSKLVAIIDEITSARDKLVPIRQLHALKTKHPELDVYSYLHRTSSTFRRFVLDILTKLGRFVSFNDG